MILYSTKLQRIQSLFLIKPLEIVTPPTPRRANAGLLLAYSRAVATDYYANHSKDCLWPSVLRLHVAYSGGRIHDGVAQRGRHFRGLFRSQMDTSPTAWRCHGPSGARRRNLDLCIYIAYGACHPLREGKPSSLSVLFLIDYCYTKLFWPYPTPSCYAIDYSGLLSCYTLNTHPTYLFVIAEVSYCHKRDILKIKRDIAIKLDQNIYIFLFFSPARFLDPGR